MKDDRIPGVELTQWRVGQVLSEDDIQILERFLREVDEAEEQGIIDFEAGRKDAFFQIGGQELVDAMAIEDQHMFERAAQRALKIFYESLRKRNAAAN